MGRFTDCVMENRPRDRQFVLKTSGFLTANLRSRAGRLAVVERQRIRAILEWRYPISDRLSHLHQRLSQTYCHLVRTLMCKSQIASRLAQRNSLRDFPNSVMMVSKQRDIDKQS